MPDEREKTNEVERIDTAGLPENVQRAVKNLEANVDSDGNPRIGDVELAKKAFSKALSENSDLHDNPKFTNVYNIVSSIAAALAKAVMGQQDRQRPQRENRQERPQREESTNNESGNDPDSRNQERPARRARRGEVDEGEIDIERNYAEETVRSWPIEVQVLYRMKHVEKHGGDLDENVVSQYRRLRGFSKIVLENEKAGRLVMDQDDKRRLQEMFDKNTDAMSLADLKEQTRILESEISLQNYFKGVEGERSWNEIRYQPDNISELMELIMLQDEPRFRRGGEYELIDYEGTVHVENFHAWLRTRIQNLHYGNLVAGIDLYGGVNVRTQMSQVTMADILLISKFTETREILINGQMGKGGQGQVEAVKSDSHEHEDFNTATKNAFWLELVVGTESHNMGVEYIEKRGDIKGIGETLGARYVKNRFTTGNRILNIMKLNKTDTKDDFTEFRDEIKDGDVGRAIRRMLLSHYYLTEFAYMGSDAATFQKQDGEAKNMFIEAMGGKDSDNLRAFYLSLTGSALGTRVEFRDEYRNFLVKTLEDEKTTSPSEAAQKIINDRIAEIKKDAHYGGAVDLNYSTVLEEVKIKIQETLTKRNLKDEDRERIKNEVKAALTDEKLKANFIDNLGGKVTYMKDDKTADVLADLNGSFSHDKDKFAVTLVQRLENISRENLNIYSLPNREQWFIPVMNKAIAEGASADLNLSKLDAQHASMYVETFVHWMGIAAKGDIEGVGFDVQGKAINLLANRQRIAQGRGSQFEQNMFGFQHVMLNFVEALKLQMDQGYNPEGLSAKEIDTRKKKYDVTLLELIQGGQGNQIDLSKDLGKYHFENQAEANYLSTHISPAIGLVNFLVSEKDLHLADFFSTDQFGNLLFDHVKAEGILRGVYGPVRASLETFGVDLMKKMRVPMVRMHHDHKTGKIINNYDFKEMTVLEYMFGEEVVGRFKRDANGNILTEKVKKKDIHGVEKEETVPQRESHGMGMYDRLNNKADDLNRRVARNALAYVISKEIMEHRLNNTTHHRWTINNILEVERFFGTLSIDKVHEHEHNGVNHVVINEKFFTHEEWNNILKLFDSEYGKMYLTEFALATMEGVGVGFLKAMIVLGRESFQSALKG